jgi:glycosyltransferase involved in cell wall biosynthesis
VISPAVAGLGGQGRAAGDMALGLEAAGLDVRYITPPPPSLAIRVSSRRPLRRVKALRRELERRHMARSQLPEFDIAYAMPALLPKMQNGGACVLHQATHHPRHVVAALKAARRAAGGGAGFINRRELRLLEGELARADLVRVESHAIAEELITEGVPRERVLIAYPGVDVARYKPGVRPQRMRVAFVGVLSLWKGVDVLVRLARTLAPTGDVAVIGGPVCPWSRQLVSDAPLRHYEDGVASLLASSHALVLPSASDGFGYVVLEAMAAGAVPFVSPEVGAAEIVRTLDDRLVQPRATFAEAVPELLRSLPLEELALAARGVAEQYERVAMAEQAAEAVLQRIARWYPPRPG